MRWFHKSYSLRTPLGALEDSLEQGGGHPQPEAHGGSTAQGDAIYLYVLKLLFIELGNIGGKIWIRRVQASSPLLFNFFIK